jgi:carbon storage regulator
MLVLSRKAGQRIRIGDDITVTVIVMRDQRVRIGIDAPRHVPVHRQEVYDDIQRNGRRSRTD